MSWVWWDRKQKYPWQLEKVTDSIRLNVCGQTTTVILELWKVYLSTWHKCGTQKNSESHTGIKPTTSRTLGSHSIHWATRTHGQQSHIAEFTCDRRPAYCWNQHCPTLVSCSPCLRKLFTRPTNYGGILIFGNSKGNENWFENSDSSSREIGGKMTVS